MSLPTPPVKFRLRPMVQADVAQVLEVDKLSFTLPWPASAYHYELSRTPQSLLWVAEVEAPDETRQIVGVIVIWLILDEAHVATLAVHPSYRRLGIARRLLVTGLQAALTHGAAQATLEVRIGNEEAQRLYRQFGFQVVGQRPRYYRDNNEDALIMTVDGLGEAYSRQIQALLARNGSASEGAEPESQLDG